MQTYESFGETQLKAVSATVNVHAVCVRADLD